MAEPLQRFPKVMETGKAVCWSPAGSAGRAFQPGDMQLTAICHRRDKEPGQRWLFCRTKGQNYLGSRIAVGDNDLHIGKVLLAAHSGRPLDGLEVQCGPTIARPMPAAHIVEPNSGMP